MLPPSKRCREINNLKEDQEHELQRNQHPVETRKLLRLWQIIPLTEQIVQQMGEIC